MTIFLSGVFEEGGFSGIFPEYGKGLYNVRVYAFFFLISTPFWILTFWIFSDAEKPKLRHVIGGFFMGSLPIVQLGVFWLWAIFGILLSPFILIALLYKIFIND